MKRIVALLVISCMLQACGLNSPRIKRKYTLENGTGREIKMEFFVANDFIKSEIQRGEGIIFEGLADDGGTNFRIDPRVAFNADSVVIIFDNERKQTYYLSFNPLGFESVPKNQDRNIFDESTYMVENIELYRYIFTEEDYENAEKL